MKPGHAKSVVVAGVGVAAAVDVAATAAAVVAAADAAATRSRALHLPHCDEEISVGRSYCAITALSRTAARYRTSQLN